MHCLRVCAYMVRQAVPSRAKSTGGNYIYTNEMLETEALQVSVRSTPLEQIALIKAGFGAMKAIGSAFGPAHKEEIRAVAISIYSGMVFR